MAPSPDPQAPQEPSEPSEIFPDDWTTALVVVAHPDDPEYGMAAAVARWTAAGKEIAYVMISSGEAGIEGLPPEECGPIREEEQRRSAAVVGVSEVVFLGFPDSALEDTPELRSALRTLIRARRPELILTLHSGPDWGDPENPNQPDHINTGRAVEAVCREVAAETGLRWLAVNGPGSTHLVDVEGFVEKAVDSLAEHHHYLSVLDPDTPVREQARETVGWSTVPREQLDGRHGIGLRLIPLA